MTTLTKTLTAAVILASVGIASSASAQNVRMSVGAVQPVQSWFLKDISSQAQSLPTDIKFAQTTHIDQFTPWTDRSDVQISEAKSPKYSRYDPTNIEYSLAGPVKLSLKSDYQELLTPNNTSNAESIVYRASSTSPYANTSYQVATTATAQVKYKF